MRKAVLTVICFLALAGFALYTVRAHDCPGCESKEKFVICHVAGQAGSTQCQTLTLPGPAACAHIGEQGTPQAGHEQDFCGPCTASCQAPVAACTKPAPARPAAANTR